jgi:hypothetical protein
MIIHYISIALEAVIVIISLLAAIIKKRYACYGLALTFAIYVFYDSVRLMNLTTFDYVIYPAFFIATLSALWAVWVIYTRKK